MTVLYIILATLGGWLVCSFLNAALMGIYSRIDSEPSDDAFNMCVGLGPLGTIIITLVFITQGGHYLYKKTFTNNPFLVVYEKARYYK